MAEKKTPPTIILTPEQDAQLQGTVQTPAPYNPSPPTSSSFPTDWQLDPNYTGPTPINQLPLPSGPINPNLPPISPAPIKSEPLPTIPITTPLPSISTPVPSETQRLPDIAPTPQFKETDQGTIITNLAEVKAYNRKYNDAVDALAPYKTGNSYNLTQIALDNKPNVEKAALLLFNDLTKGELADIRMSAIGIQEQAEYLGKKPIDAEMFTELPAGEKANYRPVTGISKKDFDSKIAGFKTQGLSSDEIEVKLADYYIAPTAIKAGEYAKLSDEERQYYYPKLSIWESLTPWKEEEGQTVSVGGVGLMGAELLIPGVYTARHWGELNTGWKTGSVILDLAAFIPVVNIASGIARTGVGGARVLGRTAMMEIRAPITQILHPVSTAKAVIAPWEAMLRPKAIPIAAVELRTSPVTMAVPWKQMGRTPEAAMMSRDLMTGLALEGKGASIQVATEAGARSIALTPTALQKSIGAAVVHTGPDMRPFMGGATIATGREGGLFVSPSLHSNFVYSSAFGKMPKGGVPGALIIRDPEILGRLAPTNKIYRNLTEIEKLLQAGEKLPAPSQILMTRDVSGQKIALLIIGEPLSKGQITKLKFLGAKDTIRDIFAPAYKTKGVSNMMDDVIELNQKITKLEKDLAIAKKAKNTVKIKELQVEIANARRGIERLTERIKPRAFSPRSLTPIGLGQGEFVSESVYNEYARYDPARFSRFLKSLPVSARNKITKELSRENRTRIERETGRVRADDRITTLWSPRVIDRRREDDSRKTTDYTTRYDDTYKYRRDDDRKDDTYKHRRDTTKDIDTNKPARGKTSLVVPIPSLKSDKSKRRFPMDSFAWKQGFGWWVSSPPYSGTIGKDMIFTRIKPAGVPIGRTPAETVTKLGINVPKGNLLDLGIMDIEIKKKGSKMKYTRDRRQKTKLGRPVGMPPGIVGARGR